METPLRTRALKKIEAISDNNAASNRSSGCLVGGERNKEQTEKGSEALVSVLHLSSLFGNRLVHFLYN